MKKFLENKFLPTLMKVGNNRHMIGIRDGISMAIPFIIVGSIFMIIANFPIRAWTNFIKPWSSMLNAPVNVTFGMLGLIAAVGVGYHLGKQLGTDPISTSLMTTLAFMLATLKSDWTVDVASLGASGMFTAIVIGIFATHVFRFFVQHNLVIKMPQGVPPSVAMSFTTLIPGGVVLATVWVLRCLLGIDLNQLITWLLSPLVVGLGTLPGMLIYSFLCCLLWVCGIHGDNILSGVAQPVFLAALAQNTHALQAGVAAPNTFVDGYFILFMAIGGTGATLGLVLNMLLSKAKMYKSLGGLSLPSAIFCINEPVIFGFPIVMNPIMMIPFIVTPLLLGTVTYVLMTIGIVGKIVIQVPWTIPPIIGPYLATNGSIGAAIWSAIEIPITFLIYLPFFKVAEKQQLLKEGIDLEKESTDAELGESLVSLAEDRDVDDLVERVSEK